MNERLIIKGIDKKTGVRYSLVEYDGGIGKFIELDGKTAEIHSWDPPHYQESWIEMVENKYPIAYVRDRKHNYPIFRNRRKYG